MKQSCFCVFGTKHLVWLKGEIDVDDVRGVFDELQARRDKLK